MQNVEELMIHCDGGARGNPGPAAVGVVIKIANYQIDQLRNVQKKLAEFGRYIGETTNNVAEYTAVIEALKYLKNHKIKCQKINFFLDSNLVVQQLSGIFKIKNPNLKDLFFKVRQLEKEVAGEIRYTHIPREQNQEADRLVNKALDQNSV